MHRQMRTVALAEYRPLGMRWLKLAPLGYGFAVRADNPLRNIKAAAVAFRKPEHDYDFVALGRGPQPLRLRAVVAKRIVEIARDEAAHDRPSRRAEPDPPGIAGYPGLRESDQAGSGGGGIVHQGDGFFD